MTIQGFRQGRMAHLAAVVTSALLVAGAPVAWASPATSAKPATALEVQSEPAGAAVYVDGHLKGSTPVAVEGIASGDHAVRVVKEGFLENSRVVSVPASGRTLHVALTPTGATPFATTAIQTEAGESHKSEGGGGKKWLFIGVGAALLAGGGGFLLYTLTKNDPPKVSGVTASPATALAGATPVSFTASASDPNGDSLTYSWTFGDGSTGTGASVTHTYLSAGTYSASVAVSDGKKTVTGTANVTVGSLTGPWSGRFGTGVAFTINFSQNGSVLSGTFFEAGFGTWPLAGTVSSPFGARWVVTISGMLPVVFDGTVNSSLNSVSGRATEGSASASFVLTR